MIKVRNITKMVGVTLAAVLERIDGQLRRLHNHRYIIQSILRMTSEPV